MGESNDETKSQRLN